MLSKAKLRSYGLLLIFAITAASTTTASAACGWFGTGPNRIWACDENKAEAAREKARVEASKAQNFHPEDNNAPLHPIVNYNSGAFGPPKPNCPKGHSHADSNGKCTVDLSPAMQERLQKKHVQLQEKRQLLHWKQYEARHHHSEPHFAMTRRSWR
jgi:hypothetical protein